MKRYINLIVELSLPLIAGVVAAVLWANYDLASYTAIMKASLIGDFYPLGEGHPISFQFLMNDIFMVLFFGIAAKEITESLLPGGALSPISRAINPIFGTLGGVFGPVGVFFGYLYMTGNMDLARGWGIPTATDIALAWLVAKVVFGAKHPAVSFLLLLAVADDGIGLGIIAVFYGDPNNPAKPIFLLLVALAMAIAYFMRKKKVESFWPYLLVPGIMAWVGLLSAHLHPALALVAIVPFMPANAVDDGMYQEDTSHEHNDTLSRFHHFFRYPVDIGLFGFGLANAGVPFTSMGEATWAVLFALVVGKSLGIFGFSAFAHMIGFKLPDGVNFRALFMIGFIAALGLTVALFVSGVAYTDETIKGAAKMGAMLSAAVAPFAILLGIALRIKKKKGDD